MPALRDQMGPLPELARCTACDKPLLGVDRDEADEQGRCCMCQWRNARAVDCGCGFLYEGESHDCVVECDGCGATSEDECECRGEVDPYDALGLRGLVVPL